MKLVRVLTIYKNVFGKTNFTTVNMQILCFWVYYRSKLGVDAKIQFFVLILVLYFFVLPQSSNVDPPTYTAKRIEVCSRKLLSSLAISTWSVQLQNLQEPVLFFLLIRLLEA